MKELEFNQDTEHQNDLMKVLESTPTNQSTKDDYIVREVPVSLEFNGISQAVMMVTPVNLKDFAIGFSLTEGIIDSISEIKGIDIFESEMGYRIAVEVNNKISEKLKERRRFLSGRSGCGICGLESLEAVYPDFENVFDQSPPSFETIQKTYQNLQNLQASQKSGGIHTAILVDFSGSVKSYREDVGRHNALDKLIGSMMDRNNPDQFFMVSSRASYEMINKTYKANISTLVSISAPTSMAISLAKKANMNLIGFVRDNRQIMYSESQNGKL